MMTTTILKIRLLLALLALGGIPRVAVAASVVAGTCNITTVAGTGSVGFSGDGGAAMSGAISSGFGIRTDASGNLYFADTNNFNIRKVDMVTHKITTVAGNHNSATGSNNVPATTSGIAQPY